MTKDLQLSLYLDSVTEDKISNLKCDCVTWSVLKQNMSCTLIRRKMEVGWSLVETSKSKWAWENRSTQVKQFEMWMCNMISL